MGISGGLTPDNIGVEFCCVIYAFAESPLDANVMWAGSNDGLVHVTRDRGGADEILAAVAEFDQDLIAVEETWCA